MATSRSLADFFLFTLCPYEFLLHKGTTVPDTLPGHIQVFDVCFAPLFAFQFE